MADKIDELIDDVDERQKFVDEIIETHFSGKTEFNDADFQKFIKQSNKKFNLDPALITFADVIEKKGDDGLKDGVLTYDNLLDVTKYLLIATKEKID